MKTVTFTQKSAFISDSFVVSYNFGYFLQRPFLRAWMNVT
jgi:hypothetical protein